MKTFTKAVLCGLYKYSGAARLHEALARRAGASFMTVVLFHRVTDEVPPDGLTVTTAWFRRFCRMARRTFNVVPLAEIFRMLQRQETPPPRTLAITFDDSYRDNLCAARVLTEHALPACFFIPTGFVGTERVFPWDEGLPRLANLSWDEVREMAALGHEIGSHTVSHPDLGQSSDDEVRRELVESKRVLEERLGRRVRWFAYPFGGPGHFRPECLPLMYEAGYEGCVSAIDDFISTGTDYPIVPRYAAPPFRSVLNFEVHLRGCLEWLYDLKQRGEAKRAARLADKAPAPVNHRLQRL